jgi:uncharacterized Zn-binding protein involved in type VI secretion
VPVPYVNSLSAADLTDGSTSVTIDGEPTALEDSSQVSTSSGDEAGTQGGNVVTHKTKGKGFFTLWSFTVKIEGKGVCRHGDPMGQNSASSPPGCVDASALTSFKKMKGVNAKKPCPPDSYPGNTKPTEEQQDKCRNGPCWEKPRAHTTSGYPARKATSSKFKGFKSGERFTPDHQPPQAVAWYSGGCHMKPSPEAFKEWARKPSSVKPHCKACSRSQGQLLSKTSVKTMRSW